MKIYLVGMPGSGKSTLGKKLASRMMVPFVDLDHEIENKNGKSVSDIFSAHGEDFFRQTESEVLREWAGSGKSFVMATGGGTPCFLQGMEVINQTGISIFLDVAISRIFERLKHQSGRPLLLTSDTGDLKHKLETLRQSRLPFYKKASFTLQNPTITSLLEILQFKK